MKRFLCGLALVAVALGALAPALAMLLDSVRGPDGFTLAAYAGVLGDRRQLVLLLRSVLVAGGAAALALVWGTAVGYACARLRGWRGVAVETLSYLPLLLPSLVVAMGWVYLAARVGAFDLYHPAGAAFVLSLCTFPCVSILAAQGFRAVDPAALRAARLVAGPGRRLWHVWRPLLAPRLATGALLAFLLALADFGVPSALMVNVYPIEVFTQFSAVFDVPRAIASCAPAAGVAGALFLLRQWLARGTTHPSAGVHAVVHGRSSRLGLALAAVALSSSVALPLAFLVWTARGAYAEALRIAGEQVLTSLSVALAGTAFMVAAGLAFAAAYRGLGARGRALGETLILLTLCVPGAAVGLGILQLVARDVWPFSALYPSYAILAYAGAARFVAFPALVLAAGVAGLRRAPLQAAAVHGAGPARTAVRIVLPLLAPSLAAAATVSFVACLGELSAAILVSPPGTMTLPVRLASLLHFGKDSIVAALCVMLAGLVAVLLALGLLLAGAPLALRLQHADRAP